MLHILRLFFSSRCRLFHNATFFGSCNIHNLNTGVLKFKRKFRLQRVNVDLCIKLLPERREFLFHILDIQISSLATETGYSDWEFLLFFSVTPDRYWISAWKQTATEFFHVLLNWRSRWGCQYCIVTRVTGCTAEKTWFNCRQSKNSFPYVNLLEGVKSNILNEILFSAFNKLKIFEPNKKKV